MLERDGLEFLSIISRFRYEKLGDIAEKYHSLQGTMSTDQLAAAIRKEAMNVLEGSV